jgi:LytS/YehU family sensor histidine kinase
MDFGMGIVGNGIINMGIASALIFGSWYVLSKTKYYEIYTNKGKMNIVNCLIIGVLFGLLGYVAVGVFNTKIGAGNFNARDLPVILAGFIGGPIGGLTAGTISGTLRWTLMSGTSHLPSSISLFIDGVIGTVLWYISGHKFPTIDLAVVTVAFAEFVRMAMIWMFSTPYEAGPAFVKDVSVPVIVYEIIAVAFATYVYMQWLEQKNRPTKETANDCGILDRATR